MPAATQISINDATPAAHLYDPVGKKGDLVLYRNVTDANTSATEEQIGLSLNRANGSRVTNKVRVSFSVPYEQTVDGAVIARSVARANMEFILPDDMSTSERADFAALCSNLLDATDVKNHLEDLTPVW